jgi:hypothetical protein
LVSLFVVCVICGFIIKPSTASAQESRAVVLNLVQIDLNSDGLPDLTTWESVLDGSQVMISVYDGSGNMQNSGDWSIATDFIDDTWLFDYMADDKVDLAIRFRHPAPDQYIASIWDDQSGDGFVSIEERQGELIFEGSDYPSLTVLSQGYWTQPDGRINADLLFEFDGFAPNMSFITYTIFDKIKGLFIVDGRQDYQVRVVDQNKDGIIDFVHNQILADVPADYGVWRNTVKVNPNNLRDTQNGLAFFWPLFNYIPQYSQENYFSSPPYIQVDWNKGKINDFGLTGYPIESGYHVVNFNAWDTGMINRANFENAMAYYDLAENQDDLPELHIRHVYWPPGDPYFYQPSIPINELRYSWRIHPSQSLTWDYSLDLSGSNAIDSTVDFAGFRVQMIPYADLPNWGLEKKWVNATFQAVEMGEYLSSEGIYEWSTTEGVIVDVTMARDDPRAVVQNSREFEAGCLLGGPDCDLGPYLTDIAVGLRGEYAFLNNDIARLYLSPIDRRLHLRNASLGLWRLASDSVIQMQDISGDGYLDLWQQKVGDQITSTLIWTPTRLIFTKEDQIVVKNISIPALEFETLPPRNHEEWQELNEYLLADENNRPGSLLAMFNQFEGELSIIQGAKIGAVHAWPGGLRFNLRLLSGYSIQGDERLGIENEIAGDYQVSLLDRWDIQPLVPQLPRINLLPPNAAQRASQPINIQVQIENPGMQDFPDSYMILEAGRGEQVLEILRQPVDILAGENQIFSNAWQPVGSGFWTLRSRLVSADNQIIQSAEAEYYYPYETQGILQMTTNTRIAVPLLLSLLGLAAILAYTFRLNARFAG